METQMPGIRDWLKIRKLEKCRTDVAKKYRGEIEAHKKAGASRDQIRNLESIASFEDRTLSDQIEAIRTRALVNRAYCYNLPVPSRDEEEAWEPDWHYLHPAHFAKLRTTIREEEKARREQILAWIPLISALTGIGGVIVAILALLNK
jgi:hypothetical protein